MSSATKLNPEATTFTALTANIPGPTTSQAPPKKSRRQRQKAAKARAANSSPANVAKSPPAQPSSDGWHIPHPIPTQPHVSGCGLRGCPVKAFHLRKQYARNDPERPNFVKKIQAKGEDATSVEVADMGRLFELHDRCS